MINGIKNQIAMNAINKGMKVGRQVGGVLWTFAKSENALDMIKVAATFAAFVHSIEEWRKANRQIGFQKKKSGWFQ